MNNDLLLEYFKVMHKELNKIQFKLDRKNRIYFPLFSSSIDHCMSIWILKNECLTSSMYALARPAIENYLRAMWVKYCVDEHEVDDDLSTMHFPNKLEFLMTEVDKKIPDFKESNFLQTRLEPLVKNIHDFTHGGLQSISRQYADGNTLTNIRNEDEITSMLKLAVVMSSLAYAEIIQDNVGQELLDSQTISELSATLIEL
ncbi:Putative uncharacterized protein [Moritella viscosa]|uniref:DUF6988 family protein n=1 Tax=Moritella viscosa TaxID=80854 RepID=UPI000508F096|nr:hypothetical protein [Moritella viscosa]CED60675.1 putative uncharacterized protein [Moritella viscosa]SHO12364.1 Putative uncharacterized protein [Moritella viscosa]SHO23048.1 Putative uncharacterized protein [Moritella viscosa]